MDRNKLTQELKEEGYRLSYTCNPGNNGNVGQIFRMVGETIDSGLDREVKVFRLRELVDPETLDPSVLDRRVVYIKN